MSDLAFCPFCGRDDVPVCPRCHERVPHGPLPDTFLPCFCSESRGEAKAEKRSAGDPPGIPGNLPEVV